MKKKIRYRLQKSHVGVIIVHGGFVKRDIIIIGGGVVGCAVARLLSRYEADVALLEGASDVSEGASKRPFRTRT